MPQAGAFVKHDEGRTTGDDLMPEAPLPAPPSENTG